MFWYISTPNNSKIIKKSVRLYSVRFLMAQKRLRDFKDLKWSMSVRKKFKSQLYNSATVSPSVRPVTLKLNPRLDWILPHV